jgi:hypothetical protein
VERTRDVGSHFKNWGRSLFSAASEEFGAGFSFSYALEAVAIMQVRYTLSVRVYGSLAIET